MSGSFAAMVDSRTSWRGSRIGRERRIRALIKLNIAVFAPIPNAIERIATAVVIGLLKSIRTPYRMSCQRTLIVQMYPE